MLFMEVKMKTKIYHTLPEEAVKIRETVFVEEQGFHDEFDEIDQYAEHMIVFDQDRPIAVCRFFQKDRSRKKDYIIGRIAVLKQYRGQKIGSFVLEAAEQEIIRMGGESISLHAQVKAKEFYQKSGYREYGEIDLDEDRPHIWMRKEILHKGGI